MRNAATGEVERVVDFAALRALLGDKAVERATEMYQFTWPGKQAARLEAASATTETLRPCPEESLNWDTTENVYIEGDNLSVLKLLQRSYLGKVKMIYIDPPYNTGNDFVYHDDFAHSVAEEDLASGNIDEEGYRFRKNTTSNGRFHSDWCSMIYSRLLVAHSLLAEDGVIFISIDDHEVHNLRKICDEVFGEGNFVAELVWKKKQGGGNDSSLVVVEHEYILIFAKSINTAYLNVDLKYKLDDKLYPFKDESGEYGLVTLDKSSIQFSQSLVFEIQDSEGTTYLPRVINGKQSCWRWSKTKVEAEYDKLVFKNGKVYTKYYRPKGITPKSLLVDSCYGRTETGNDDIKLLFTQAPFSYPKPVALLEHLIQIGTSPDSLILDFFSGSATTAHAVMQLNAEDGGKRKYICVQLPEATPEGSEARKAGYATIPEIAKERIRRAGKKIKEAPENQDKQIDTGFRVFKLDSTHYNDVSMAPGLFSQENLEALLDNIKADRTHLDLLFGALLSWGVPLSLALSMETDEVDGRTIYHVPDGGLVACFDTNITENVVRHMAALAPERLLFHDHCFADDKTKINLFELLKQTLDWEEKEALQNIRVI